jgi:hypothetical protein
MSDTSRPPVLERLERHCRANDGGTSERASLQPFLQAFSHIGGWTAAAVIGVAAVRQLQICSMDLDVDKY